MIDRARVYVQQTNALVMFVCFILATFIINSIITYTRWRLILSSFIERGLGETFTQPSLGSLQRRKGKSDLLLFSLSLGYKTSSRSLLLTQVDNRWWSDDGGH